jgi:hypothetical protein
MRKTTKAAKQSMMLVGFALEMYLDVQQKQV